MSQLLYLQKDQQGIPVYAPFPADIKESVTLLSLGLTSTVVPIDYEKYIINFSYSPGAVIWVAYEGDALPPEEDELSDTNSELLPAQRTLYAGTTISLFNNGISAADVGIVMYATV
jgi:hypothetical protein